MNSLLTRLPNNGRPPISASASASASADYKGEHSKIIQVSVTDLRNFKPYEVKESEQWSWRKMRNEKWYTMIDCKTNKPVTWKLGK